MKNQLRKKYKDKRQALSVQERERLSRSIAQHFIQSEFTQNQTFHIFIPIEKFKEIQTEFIITELWKQNKKVIVPKINNNELLNCLYNPDTVLAENHWGVKEPKKQELIPNEDIDIVLLPMLICDKNGNRIGYGGGFYDRFLPNLKPNVKLVGINYFEPIDFIENENHDIPLDTLITPKGFKKFKEKS